MPSTLESIRHLSETLFQYTNVDDMVRQVLHTALDVIGEDAGSILIAEEKSKQLIFRYVIGESAEQLCGTSIPWDKGIAGAVFSSGQAEIIPAVRQDQPRSAASRRPNVRRGAALLRQRPRSLALPRRPMRPGWRRSARARWSAR